MRRALNMMNYAILSTKAGYRKYPQVFIALMMFFGTFFCEAANLLLLCTIDNPQDITINMIAFMVVAEIQNFYSNSLQNFPLREKTPEVELEVKSWKESDNRFGLLGVITFLVYKILKAFYECFYYYFMPFAVVFLTFLITNGDSEHIINNDTNGGDNNFEGFGNNTTNTTDFGNFTNPFNATL